MQKLARKWRKSHVDVDGNELDSLPTRDDSRPIDTQGLLHLRHNLLFAYDIINLLIL